MRAPYGHLFSVEIICDDRRYYAFYPKEMMTAQAGEHFSSMAKHLASKCAEQAAMDYMKKNLL